MNTWLEKQLKIQFDRAIRLGWLPFFVEAALKHTTGFFDAADLLGIASRETNLDPKWLSLAGDNGNGFGLMQADVRSFPEWIKSGKWRDAREGVLMGARVLMMKLADIENCIGKRVEVRSSKTKTVFTFIGKRVEGAELQTVAIAAYNGGRWAHYAVSRGQNASKYTTGGDYAIDVQARAKFLRPLIEKWISENAVTEDNPASSLPLVVNADNQSVALTPTEPAKEDSFLASALDRNVSAEEMKTVARSAAPKILFKFSRPFLLLYAALEAGNVAAWLGTLAGALVIVYLIYAHRADLKRVWETVKNKFLQ